MKILSELPLEQGLGISLQVSQERNARTIKVKGRRFSVANLKSFALHGCKCARCGLEGKRLIAWEDNGGGIHVDLFSQGEKGGLVLMNRDHIIPKSKKGPNTDWNYQTMCVKCNCKKGNNETPQDLELAKFRARWRAIHVAMHDGYWKFVPKFLRARWLTKASVTFRDTHLHKFTYVLARLTV